ncbi:MAG: DUF4333 domain-containing protein [Actinomycetota bacterium]
MSQDTGVPASAASPVPGWYPDPAGAAILRWWDGSTWIDRTQPLSGPGSTAEPSMASAAYQPGQPGTAYQGGQTDAGYQPDQAHGASQTGQPNGAYQAGQTEAGYQATQPVAGYQPGAPAGLPPAKGAPVPWAWGVASAPLLLLAVAAAVAALGGQGGSASGYILIGDVVACVVAVVMSYRDARALVGSRDLGGTGIAWWSLLAPWAYLWARAVKRSNRTNLDWILLAVSLGMWFLVIGIATPIVNSVATANTTFNRVKVQNDIARGIHSQLGVTAVVNCPQDPPIHPGSTFQCIARAKDGSRALVTVTIQDRSGDYTWRTSQ